MIGFYEGFYAGFRPQRSMRLSKEVMIRIATLVMAWDFVNRFVGEVAV